MLADNHHLHSLLQYGEETYAQILQCSDISVAPCAA